jgi:serine/threonine protein kinase
MNSRAPQTSEDGRSLDSNSDSMAQFSENKISKLLAECLEEARCLHPGSLAARAVPLTRDLEVEGPFTTVCKLASGGTATVYLAVDHRADAAERLVVVKQYSPAFTHSHDFSAQFTRELSLARTVNHPSVCRLFDYGRSSNGYYIATEFLQGEPLESALTAPAFRTVANRSPRLLAHLIAELAEGLHALHTIKGAAKPVHGDVTPDNLFVLYDGHVRVANFGTAWIRELSQKREASDKSYLSPEQLEGSAFDARADIWALGVVLWELLAGKKLFHCTTNLEAVVEILSREIPSPFTETSQVTTELTRIVLKCLARDPDDRYRSARELSLELERFLAQSGGPVAQTEVVAWLTRLFPNGADRCLGMLELAAAVPAPLSQFADSFGSAPPVSYAYTPASEDEVEHTTQIYAPKVDENTLRSLELPLQSRKGPRAPRRLMGDADAWHTTFAPFAAAFAIVLLGFFAGHQTFSRTRSASSPAAVPTFEIERKHAPPVAAAAVLAPTVSEPSANPAELGATEDTTQPPIDFDADEVDSQPTPNSAKVAPRREGTPARTTPKSAPPSPSSTLTTQLGDVYVTTPGGGDVYEHGRYLGRAPGGFALTPGWHTLLVKSGDEDRMAGVDVPAGAAVVVTLPAGNH